MSLSKNFLSNYHEQVANRLVRQNQAREFVENLKFERNHPFFPEWSEWKQVVSDYYSYSTGYFLTTFFNRSSNILPFNREIINEDCKSFNGLIDFWKIGSPKTKLSEILYSNRVVYPGEFTTGNKLYCDCAAYYFGDIGGSIESYTFPYTDCPNQRKHILNIYLSLIYHLQRKCRRAVRKYYRRLARVIYVLPTRFLLDIDVNSASGLGELLFRPEKIQRTGRNLLRQIYERGILDKWYVKNFNEMPFVFESWKHSRDVNPLKNTIKQQGGTSQSVSASMFDEIAQLVSEWPEQQGKSLFNVGHEIKITDDQFNRFEASVLQTQQRFMSNLQETLFESAKEMMVMFVFTAVVAMLGYTVIKYGMKVIIKALNLLYQVVKGGFLRDEHRIVQQSDGLSIPFLPAMIVDNVISPPTQILQKVWNNPQTDKVMRRIGYLGDPKMSRGVDKITEWLNSVIESTVRWYKEVILGLACMENIDTVCSPVQKWYEDCDEFFKSYYEGKMAWTDINWSILMNLYGRGMALTRQSVFNEFKNDIWKIVFKLGNLLEKFNTHGRTGTSVRNPPVTIYLAGGTGVGKSSVTYPLAAEILKGIFQQEPSPTDLSKYWKNLIYMRSPEQEFWDGYENQLVTVFDDFGQLVDSSSAPNLELFEIIRAANSFPYPLHMASIDQKATTTFNSKIILVSSNLDQPKTASLNFVSALYRRFDICVKVTRKPGVVVQQGKFDPTIYEFQLYDMLTQKLGEFITYKDLVYASVTRYFARKGFVDSMDDYITKTLSETPVQQGGNPENVKKEYRKQQAKERLNDTKEAWRIDTLKHPILLPKNPKQQGLGTALGNTVCAVKQGVKYSIDSVVSNYRDFAGAINGDDHYRYMAEIRIALENFRFKLLRVGAMWESFKKEHKYLYKAMKFFGIVALIFGVIKLYNSFTASEKKEKLMSPEQFVKGGVALQAKQEAYTEVKPLPNPKVEAYTEVKIQNPRVESICEHEFLLKRKTECCHVIDNTRCEMCSVSGTNQNRVFGPIEEGYNPPNLRNPRVEFMGIVPGRTCEHNLMENFKSNPFRVWFLFKDKDCARCNHIVQEGVKDLNASEILMKCIRSNFYKIYNYDTLEAIGHCIFLRGRIVLCPRHYVSAFRRIQGNGGTNKVYFQNVFLQRCFEVEVSDILANAYYHESPEETGNPILSRDIMAFPLRTATFHANIVPYFADKSNLSFLKSSDVVMPVLINNNLANSDRAMVGFNYTKGHSGLAVKEETQIDDENGITQRIMRNIWEYSMDTKMADCGAPLIVRNVNIAPGKIIGIHVAGHDHGGMGYATPIYKNDVETIISKFNEWDSVEFRMKQQLNEYPTQQCQVPASAEFIRLGSVDRPVAQPTRTKILPSPIHGKIQDPLTRPCALKPINVNGEIFDPRSYRLGRLGNIPQFIRQLEIDLAIEALTDDISQNIQKTDFGPNIKSVYSFEEAVVGIDGEEFINSIKRNTSPGYPFVHLKGFENRKSIFGDDEKCDMSRTQCKILQKRVEDIISDCKQGIIKEHIFMDTLKDERKPIHKSHKTRLFSAGPLDYLIACKMYFNGVVAVLQKARNFCGVSVGTNVFSNDWHNISRLLLSKANNVVAGDFEGFDASQIVQLLEAAGKVLINISKRFCGTTDEEAYVMWCLLISLFNSVHITGKEVYMWTHSLPSGHYLTAIINSIFVLLSFCIVWQYYQRRKTGKPTSYLVARSFYKKCGKVAYGDDHVITVPSSEEGFNQQTLTELFAEIGLSYTMEDKDVVATSKFRKLEEVAYLKRKFCFDKDLQRWLGPLDLKTILESPMWIHKCPDPEEQTKTQIDNSLRELSLHDLNTWNKWYTVFAKCGKQLGHYTEFAHHADTRAVVIE